jgi:hypothetical protein
VIVPVAAPKLEDGDTEEGDTDEPATGVAPVGLAPLGTEEAGLQAPASITATTNRAPEGANRT